MNVRVAALAQLQGVGLRGGIDRNHGGESKCENSMLFLPGIFLSGVVGYVNRPPHARIRTGALEHIALLLPHHA